MLTTEGNAMRFWIELFRLVIGRRVGELRGGGIRGKFIIEAPEFIEFRREENLGD